MQSVSGADLRGLLACVTEVLERRRSPYMIVGGLASALYGEPRFTAGVDIVVDMRAERMVPFVEAFSDADCYLNEGDIHDALLWHSPFTALQGCTGAKVDLIPLREDALTRAARPRRRRTAYDGAGHVADVVSPEDFVLANLGAYRRVRSDRHLGDARKVRLMQWGELALDTIREGARNVRLEDILDWSLAQVRRQMGE